jgi:hypothetical protein
MSPVGKPSFRHLLRYFLWHCVAGGGQGCAHAGMGAIREFPARASRMAVMPDVA